MSRPQPRKSSLAGASPLTPTPPQPAQPSATQKRKYPHKVSFYQDPADTARVRGALAHTMGTEDFRSMADLINRAVMTFVTDLEARYNDGQPFPPVGARRLPQGRPLGTDAPQGHEEGRRA